MSDSVRTLILVVCVFQFLLGLIGFLWAGHVFR